MSRTKTERLWGIVGKYGLYFGSVHGLRKVSIAEHVQNTGKPWDDRRAAGDRAVRITVTYEWPWHLDAPRRDRRKRGRQ